MVKLFLRQQVPQGITGFTHLPRNVRLIAMLSSPFPATGRGFLLFNPIKSRLPKPICKWNEVNFKCPVQRFWKLRRLLLLI